ncbi:hypothetical protein C4565_00400 [Candidatus Parcubacteria bacterium]|nr:MAG: hypothetical protein C4565_00400 [Candidatus Parcubacteria bacterium]
MNQNIKKIQDEILNKDNPADVIDAGQPGFSPETPFTHMPEHMPYGAWFKCFECKQLARSTISFDCFAKKTGDLLRCEMCALHGSNS